MKLIKQAVVVWGFIVWMFSFQAASVLGGEDVWTPLNGPKGGPVRMIAVHPAESKVVYALSDCILRSTDFGENWKVGNWILTMEVSVSSICIDPQNSDAIHFVGDGCVGYWSSRELGMRGIGFPVYVYSLAIDSTNPIIRYAGTSEGVLKSTDSGKSWRKINNGLKEDISVQQLLIHPKTPQTLYIVVSSKEGDAVFLSSDGGENWRDISKGLPSYLTATLAIAPNTPEKDTLYVGVDATSGGGIFKSDDGGDTWREIKGGLPKMTINDIEVDPLSIEVIYACGSAGIFKSTGGGENWKEINRGLPSMPIYSLAIDPNTSNTLYAGGENRRIFKSIDGGESWKEIKHGLASSITAIAIDEKNPKIIYVGTESRMIFKSIDGGENWMEMNNGENLQAYASNIMARVTFLVINSIDSEIVYAGTGEEGHEQAGYLFKSEDGGKSFREFVPDYGWFCTSGCGVFSLAIDPQNPQVLYAGVGNAVHGLGGVCKSIDGGESWVRVFRGGLVKALAIDPSNPQIVYSGIYCGQEGVYRSIDGGNSWEEMNNGLSFRWFGEEETIPFVTSLAIDPKTPSTIYAGTSQEGLYKSADGARNWERINAQGFDFISVNLGNPRILYGIFSGVLILRSMDGGKNWERFDKGLPGEPPGSRCLAIDPKNPRKVYVGTYRGLYSIIQTDISVITAVSPNGKMFTEWGCLKQDALFQNYPNPFNPETWISYQLAEDDFVTIEIYDTFGNLIHTIPLGIQKAGFYLTKDEAAHWDGRNKQGEFVASGIYFITLKTSRFTDTRKAAMKK